MRILDRYILKSFMVNYLLALVVLVGLYVLLDIIVNVHDFAKGATLTAPAQTSAMTTPAGKAAKSSEPTTWDIASDMIDYYTFQLPVIFQQVSGMIPLLAAGFTMMRMTRHHELTAMLSSGVSLYRVAAPIIFISMTMATLNVLNQEFLISQPWMIEKLLRKHNEVNQVAERTDHLYQIKDTDGSILSADKYDSRAHTMSKITIIARDAVGMPLRCISAETATWEVPDPSLVRPGEAGRPAWVLHNVQTQDLNSPNPYAARQPTLALSTGLSPDQLDLILSRKALDYLSSARVRELAQFSPEINRQQLYKIMNLRFTQPLMNIIMLLIGIPFLLTREPNRLVMNMVWCTILSGTIFIVSFVVAQMGGAQLNPLWAAWLPVLVFGPFALVMLDTIHT